MAEQGFGSASTADPTEFVTNWSNATQALQSALDGVTKSLQGVQKALGDTGKAGKAAADPIKEAFTSVNRAVEQSITGMILGTRNWQQAMQNVFRTVVSASVHAIDQMLSDWISGELGKTAATETGAAERSAAEQAGQSSSLADMAGSALKYIFNAAAQTFAGVFAFLSDLLGPGAAAPAAAAQATVLAVAGDVVSAAGGFEVPNDTLAFLHQDEVVLPKALADGFRGIIAGQGRGGGGTGDVHLHVQALDSADVARFFKQHGRTLARVVNGELKDNISLRPNF